MNLAARLALPIVLGCACVSTNQAVKPGGGTARIAFRNGARLPAELLAVDENDLFFLNNQRVWRTPLAEVTSVHVEGYGMRTAKHVILGLFGAADVGLSVLSFTQGCWPFGVIAIPVLAGGVYMSLSSEPTVDFTPPLSLSAQDKLAGYCRYPKGLTSAQWQELTSYYHQDRFARPGEVPKP